MCQDFLRQLKFAAAIFILAVAGCSRQRDSVVDDAALRAADADSADWLTYGRTYAEQRFSPLKQIDEQSVGQLGLAWSFASFGSNFQSKLPVLASKAYTMLQGAVAYKTPSFSRGVVSTPRRVSRS